MWTAIEHPCPIHRLQLTYPVGIWLTPVVAQQVGAQLLARLPLFDAESSGGTRRRYRQFHRPPIGTETGRGLQSGHLITQIQSEVLVQRIVIQFAIGIAIGSPHEHQILIEGGIVGSHLNFEPLLSIAHDIKKNLCYIVTVQKIVVLGVRQVGAGILGIKAHVQIGCIPQQTDLRRKWQGVNGPLMPYRCL